jgi:protein-S-isoprenylcysteine O-methyltransferase Ste14
MIVVILKVYLVGIFIGFIRFGMDIRSRPTMRPLVLLPYIRFMQVCCFILLSIYILSVFHISILKWGQLVTMILTTLGVCMVAWAKTSLGKSFTWTGFHLSNPVIVRHGPYQYFKHPLYYGVFLFEMGALINFVTTMHDHPHFFPLFLVGCLALFYAVGFNLIMARKETLLLNASEKR